MFKKIVWTVIAIVVLAGSYLAFVAFKSSVHNPSDAYFYIQPGDDASTVKKNLVEQGFVSNGSLQLCTRFLKLNRVQPGRYKFNNGTSLYHLLKMLRNGVQTPVKMVIIKERTKELFAGKIGKGKKYDLAFDSTTLMQFLNSNDSLRDFGVDTTTVMAIVMPYTYEMSWSTTPRKLVQQFYTAYKKFWTPERTAAADSIHLTPLQAVTMASIIEEETNRKADKYNIASTYLNRLATGMKLQADPTVRFATRDFTLKRITGALLQIASPYNTYQQTGLPPGPICTPSVESLEAVLHAPKTDYLYFVASSKFDGSTIFTADYNEHMKYARAYQAELTRRMDSARKANAK